MGAGLSGCGEADGLLLLRMWLVGLVDKGVRSLRLAVEGMERCVWGRGGWLGAGGEGGAFEDGRTSELHLLASESLSEDESEVVDGLGMVGVLRAVFVRFRRGVVRVDHRARRHPSWSLVAHVGDPEVSSGGQGYEGRIDD
jgi:hypothetical protein